MKLQIEKMVYGGSGLSHTDDGQVVLVPFTLPGEIITVENLVEKSNYISALPELVEQPHGHRVHPPCKYFRECGGCHYQHVNYETQLLIKRAIITEQFERIGGGDNLPIHDTVSSSNTFKYRNHVQFHLDETDNLGFQRAQSHDVVAIDSCLILEDALNDLLHTLNFDANTGLQRVAIRDDGVGIPVLLLSGNTPNPPEFEVDFPLHVVYRGPAGDMALSGDGYNLFSILGREFRVSAGSFFQTNRDVAEKLVNHLLEKIQPNPSSVILDGYCGVGFFSSFLAERAGRIIGIESSEDACGDFVANLDQFDNVELYQGNVEVILPELDIRPDFAVVDPPRAGIAVAAIKALIKARPGLIAYISCEPSTLARDIKILTGAGYNVDSITPFDMFPQTYHIESLVYLSRKS